MEQKTVVDTSLRELRRHGSDDFPIGIYRDDFSEFEHGQIAWHWHDEIQFDYIIKGTILVQVGTSEFVLKPAPPPTLRCPAPGQRSRCQQCCKAAGAGCPRSWAGQIKPYYGQLAHGSNPAAPWFPPFSVKNPSSVQKSGRRTVSFWNVALQNLHDILHHRAIITPNAGRYHVHIRFGDGNRPHRTVVAQPAVLIQQRHPNAHFHT